LKKSKKLLIPSAGFTMPAPSSKADYRIVPPAQEAKVFWFFSSEKNILPASKFD
jgi:hypothetical protein